jgi:DnaK suppressor protein
MKKSRASNAAGLPKRVAAANGLTQAVGIPQKWRAFYRKLQELRDLMLAQNRSLLEEAREPVGTSGSHLAESGTDEFERGLHFSLLATEQNALHEVEAAMQRIESGTFGVCQISGKRIPLERLRAVPWTRYTAPIETELEADCRSGKTLQHRNGAQSATRPLPNGTGRLSGRLQPPNR